MQLYRLTLVHAHSVLEDEDNEEASCQLVDTENTTNNEQLRLHAPLWSSTEP